MAAASGGKENCEICQQVSPLGQKQPPVSGNKCCPPGCQLCDKKKCKEEKKCKCNECTCGCQDEENKDKSCKDSSCVACKVICKGLKDDQRCRCTFCDCGCERALKEGKLCHNDSNDCANCKTKCGKSTDGTCICKLCNCGCNGVNCQCCIRCNPETKCEGKDTCDTEEVHDDKTCPKGMCKEKPGSCITLKCQCKGMGIKLERKDQCDCQCKCGGECPRVICAKAIEDKRKKACDKTKSGKCGCECRCSCNAYGFYYNKSGNKVEICNQDQIHFYGIGKCLIKCTNCGRLCDQDRCMNWIRVIVIGLIILASLFVLRAIFPEKFRAIMTKIRATFARSPAHSGRSLNNLVGRIIPEETNVDLYPAFRPRTYAGLS